MTTMKAVSPVKTKEFSNLTAVTRVVAESRTMTELQTSQRETFSEETILGLKDVFYENEPDLTYYCSECRVFVGLSNLRDHRSYHAAIECLSFEIDSPPKSTEALTKRRNQLFTDMKTESFKNSEPFNTNKAHKINDAYEFLKQDIEDTFESCRKINEKLDTSVEGMDVDCSVDFVQAVGYCSNQNSRWKSMMEDTKVYQDHFGDDPSRAFVAIYDGYNGKYASAVAANELHYLFLNELSNSSPDEQCVCTFNMMEENNISGYDLIRPPTPTAGYTNRIHRNSTNIIHQMIYLCEEPADDCHKHLSTHHPVVEKYPCDRVTTPKSDEKSTSDRIKSAFKVAYNLTDEVMSFGGSEKSRVRWSGCSALTIMIEQTARSYTPQLKKEDPLEEKRVWSVMGSYSLGINPKIKKQLPVSPDYSKSPKNSPEYQERKTPAPPEELGKLHIAHAGNCQALLIRNNKSYPLCKTHTIDNVKEKKRIELLGGRFSNTSSERLVNGVLPITRGLGNHGDPELRSLILNEPQYINVNVDQYCQMLVLATPGVWKALSYNEAADILLQALPQNRMPTPQAISPSLEVLLQPQTATEKSGDKTGDKLQVLNDKAETSSIFTDNATLPDIEVKAASPKPTNNSSGKPDNSKLDVGQVDMTAVSSQTSIDGRDSFIDVRGSRASEEMKSLDSGHEGDVDTDWASSLAGYDIDHRSISTKYNIPRQISRLLAERLVQAAILAGAKDNLTAIVVLLPGTKL